MSEVKWSDVAHLYIGCEVKTETGYVPLKMTGVRKDDFNMVHDAIVLNGNISHSISFNSYKPILRPLEDMTEEEAKELNLGDVQIGLLKYADKISLFLTAKQLVGMLKMGFDLYGLISSGQAISKNDKG